MNDFHVIICGSKNFKNYELLKTKCNFYLSNKIKEGRTVKVISGSSGGVDNLGEKFAEEMGFEIIKIPADWDKYGKSAGYRRDSQMTDLGNACIAFLDKTEDKRIKRIIEIARQKHLLVREVRENE